MTTALANGKEQTRNIDHEIEKLLSEIAVVDATIRKLNEKRIILTAKYEDLHEEKLLNNVAIASAEHDWENGERLVECVNLLRC